MSGSSRPREQQTAESRQALKSVLDQLVTQPSDHLCRRLREADGSDWFIHVWRRAVALTVPTGLEDLGGGELRERLRELKSYGKDQLKRARLTEEIEEATATYFGATVRLLADLEAARLESVSSIPVVQLEEVLLTLQQSVPGEWAIWADRALVYID